MAQRISSTKNSIPALVAAARDGDLALVRQLVEQGHNLDARDQNGASALYWACCRGHDDICEFLLDAGSDANSCVNWGATALLAAADNGHETCLKQLLRRNVAVNIQNDRGDTALHVAAYRGYLNIICLLEGFGADPFIKNSSSLTPVQEAYTQQRHECVNHLLQYMESLGMSRFNSMPTTALGIHDPPASLDDACSSWPVKRKVPSPPQIPRFSGNRQLHLRRPTESGTDIPDELGIVPPRGLEGSSKSSNGNHSGALAICSSSTDKTGIENSITVKEKLCEELDAEIASFDSLSGTALQIPTRQGCPSQSAKYTQKENKTTVLLKATTAVDAAHHNLPPLDDKDYLSPPMLPPRPSRKVGPQGQLPKVAPTQAHLTSKTDTESSEEADPSRRTKRTHREVMPGVRVGDFVEQLQLQMVEMQERLTQMEALNSQLREQLHAQQRENHALRTENSHLLSLLHPRKTRSFQPRGQAEPGSDVKRVVSTYQRCYPSASPYPHLYTSESDSSDADNGGKRAVETSEHDTDF